MKIPRHLQHKPIIAVDDYEKIDAFYSNNSDAQYLSVGLAQYHNEDISVKVWRYTGNKWSRMSEELPIHRNLDLSILFVASILTDPSSKFPKSNLREQIVDESKLNEISDYYIKHKTMLRPRLEELNRLITTFLNNK